MSGQVRLLGQVKYPCPGCKRWVLCDLYWRGAYCQLSIHDHTPRWSRKPCSWLRRALNITAGGIG